jgi:hypothetical protein
MPAVKFDDLLLAFHFVAAAAPGDNNAYICLDTGEIFWTSEVNWLDALVPRDLETSDRYASLPHKNDLDLGRRLALRFVASELPQFSDEVEAHFRRKGAYGRFKNLLDSEGVLEQWYKYQDEAIGRALRDWCASHDIQVIEDDRARPAVTPGPSKRATSNRTDD